MAATGYGKTYCGMRLIKEALDRDKRAIFVCDRITLIDQTSEVADRYGLPHGVIQANHWRTDYSKQFQIASLQTLAARGWPDADLIVIDESHAMYKGWTEHVKKTSAHVIGLSATPFSKGLGNIFTNLINAATMAELTADGTLVPLRVYSCTKADIRGAATQGGEWTDRAAEERELEIVGDIVLEWQRYGENRKTIGFGPTINWCEETARQFSKAGIRAEVTSAETSVADHHALLQEFKKEDSQIKILLSVEKLAKGFDVPDCIMPD